MTQDQWVDLFEARTLDQIIGQEELVKAFKEYVRLRHIPNMTIAGAPGCGKTLLMKCFATDLGFIKYDENGKLIDLIPGQFYLMDASTDRGIDIVRGTIKRLASKPTIDDMPRLIVLDEFNFTPDAQAAMRALIQEFSTNVRFIILSNDPSNIIEPIISRCPLKTAKPLTLENVKTLIERIQKVKEFKISPEAIEYLYKITMGDMRQFIGKLQDLALISNFNIQIQHIQNVDIDIEVAKSILIAAQSNYDQAREVIVTIYTKNRDAKAILEKIYFATYMVRFSDDIQKNRIMSTRLRNKISELSYYISQGTSPLVQLDALINYIELMKYIPLTCPKVV